MEPVQPKRKIPRGEWQAIATRHAGGESLASIARTYNCTAPAIRYIVRQGRKTPASSEQHGADAGFANEHPLLGAPLGAADETARPRATGPTGGFNFALREAMTLEVSAFLVAFDAVVAEPTERTFEALRAAADRLLRATARIRIEVERLSAPRRAGSGSRAESAESLSRAPDNWPA